MSQDEVMAPEEVAAGVEQKQLRPEDYAPEDLAAAFFTLNHKRLIQGLNHMSKRQLIRVCYHLAAMGLKDVKADLKDDIEKRCAYVMNEMIYNRVIMQLQAEMEKADRAAEKELSKEVNHDIIKPELEQLAETKLESKDGEAN